MIRSAFHIEIILQGEKKDLSEDAISTVLRNWQRSLKSESFKNEEIKIKVIKIRDSKLDNSDGNTKGIDPWRHADPLTLF